MGSDVREFAGVRVSTFSSEPDCSCIERGSTILLQSNKVGGKQHAISVQDLVSCGSRKGAAKDGFKAIQDILEQQKPEAAYFVAENGKRTRILIMDMQGASEIPAISEPWFLALNAEITVTPAMVAADLQKAAPAIAQAVKMYG